MGGDTPTVCDFLEKAPSSKLQAPKTYKFQAPNPSYSFRILELFGTWNLELGI